LVGDIGSGKTALTRGIAGGFGSSDSVASPSFTLSRIYKRKDGKQIDHYDFYRLEEAGIMKAEVAESLADEDVVVIVEWAGLVEGILPSDRLRIEIEMIDNENSRAFTLRAKASHGHLLKGLQT